MGNTKIDIFKQLPSKLKLSKTVFIVLGAGIMVLAVAILIMTYSRQAAEQKRLKDEMAVSQDRLSKLELVQLISRKESLEEELNQVSSELQDIKDTVGLPINSISANDILFALARECNVTLTSSISSDVFTSRLNDIPCYILTMAISVEGELPDIVDFIFRLKTDFINGRVDSIGISTSGMPGETTEITELLEIIEETEGPSNPTASIKFTIYSYKGSE
ncbi:MAG: hypothetical protein JW856_01345 [Dehalococcoidales bacterium]|nr:hypothetical protein [Dehalococcoidales bacterium]